NQGAYDLWGNLNMAVAGLCIPVSQAVNGVAGASKSIIAKEAVKAIGKETSFAIGVNWVSSNITNFAVGELELNQTESTLLNLGLNFGIGIGGYKLRRKFFGEASFAKGMSYDDAKRYNDYWKQVESGNNTGYPGLSDADIKLWKFADNKLNTRIALNKVDPNEVVKLRIKALELENSLKVVDKGVSKASPAEVAQSWQGSFPYVGVDKYKNITLKKGKVIYVGDPYPTGYATTKSALDRVDGDARKLFEGLQVKPYWEDGMDVAEYRGKMMAYEITEPIDVAFGITKANPQFGSGGLPQMFLPDFKELLSSGKIRKVELKAVELNNYKMHLDDYNKMLDVLEGLK
ncbi:hypothetical protein, partial [Clostridium nigeriense]